jgi:RNA polymerase sigma-70 factor (ECF subfamily)
LDFRTIFETESEYVWRSLRRLGVRDADLDDVTHDVFVVVFRQLATYDPSRPLRPWLFGIAAKLAANYRRRARPESVPPESFDRMADRARGADEQIESNQAVALVNETLDALEMDKRAVFVMHEIDGHTVPEISEALDIPLNTAYSRLRLAREEFATALQRVRLRRGER